METAKLNIKQWAEDDRPREKMMQKGASALSNAELLAILIGSGTVEESAVGLMKRVMADCDNRLKTLGRMSLEELTGNVEVWDKETGKEKEGAPLQRAGRSQGRGHHGRLRTGRRRMEEDAVELPSIRSSVDLYHYFLPQMQDLFHEECYVLLMNQACRILDKVLVSKGGLTETAVDIRLTFARSLVAPCACHRAFAITTRRGRCAPVWRTTG